MHPTMFPRFFTVAAAVFLCLALLSPQLPAGLENGEAAVNNEPPVEGGTVLATQVLDLMASDFPLGSSSVHGNMFSFDLAASGSITNEPFQAFTLATSLVEFVDDLFVTAEGIPTGTELIVEVTWQVTGTTIFNSPDRIPAYSKLLLRAEGVDLDPDPMAPPPPLQIWTRERSNRAPAISDDLGEVKFEFLVQAGTIQPGNIRMRSVAGVQCGPAIFGISYLSTAFANVSVSIVGVTDVKTTDGRRLYRWDTSAISMIDYGSRDDDPPSNPTLTVGPSTGGPALVNLSWDTVVGEFYLVQTTTDNSTWTTVTEVLGTGNTVDIDLFKDDAVVNYRLISDFGFGTPSPALVTPELRVLRIDEGGPTVRVVWQTHHWELYALNELDSTGTPSELESASGNGGLVWFDFAPITPGQIFQVSAVLK